MTPDKYFAGLKPGTTVFTVEAAARRIFGMRDPSASDLRRVRASMMASEAHYKRAMWDGEYVDVWSVER